MSMQGGGGVGPTDAAAHEAQDARAAAQVRDGARRRGAVAAQAVLRLLNMYVRQERTHRASLAMEAARMWSQILARAATVFPRMHVVPSSRVVPRPPSKPRSAAVRPGMAPPVLSPRQLGGKQGAAPAPPRGRSAAPVLRGRATVDAASPLAPPQRRVAPQRGGRGTAFSASPAAVSKRAMQQERFALHRKLKQIEQDERGMRAAVVAQHNRLRGRITEAFAQVHGEFLRSVSRRPSALVPVSEPARASDNAVAASSTTTAAEDAASPSTAGVPTNGVSASSRSGSVANASRTSSSDAASIPPTAPSSRGAASARSELRSPTPMAGTIRSPVASPTPPELDIVPPNDSPAEDSCENHENTKTAEGQGNGLLQAAAPAPFPAVSTPLNEDYSLSSSIPPTPPNEVVVTETILTTRTEMITTEEIDAEGQITTTTVTTRVTRRPSETGPMVHLPLSTQETTVSLAPPAVADDDDAETRYSDDEFESEAASLRGGGQATRNASPPPPFTEEFLDDEPLVVTKRELEVGAASPTGVSMVIDEEIEGISLDDGGAPKDADHGGQQRTQSPIPAPPRSTLTASSSSSATTTTPAKRDPSTSGEPAEKNATPSPSVSVTPTRTARVAVAETIERAIEQAESQRESSPPPVPPPPPMVPTPPMEPPHGGSSSARRRPSRVAPVDLTTVLADACDLAVTIETAESVRGIATAIQEGGSDTVYVSQFAAGELRRTVGRTLQTSPGHSTEGRALQEAWVTLFRELSKVAIAPSATEDDVDSAAGNDDDTGRANRGAINWCDWCATDEWHESDGIFGTVHSDIPVVEAFLTHLVAPYPHDAHRILTEDWVRALLSLYVNTEPSPLLAEHLGQGVVCGGAPAALHVVAQQSPLARSVLWPASTNGCEGTVLHCWSRAIDAALRRAAMSDPPVVVENMEGFAWVEHAIEALHQRGFLQLHQPTSSSALPGSLPHRVASLLANQSNS